MYRIQRLTFIFLEKTVFLFVMLSFYHIACQCNDRLLVAVKVLNGQYQITLGLGRGYRE